MKKNPTAWLQLFLVVLTIGFAALTTKANDPISTNQISPCDVVGDWTLISQKDGIKVYYSTISCKNDSYLAIKFENTTDVSTTLVWSLTNNSEPVKITEDEMQEERIQISENSAHVFKGTYLVPLKNEEDYSNFKVTTTTLKN